MELWNWIELSDFFRHLIRISFQKKVKILDPTDKTSDVIQFWFCRIFNRTWMGLDIASERYSIFQVKMCIFHKFTMNLIENGRQFDCCLSNISGVEQVFREIISETSEVRYINNPIRNVMTTKQRWYYLIGITTIRAKLNHFSCKQKRNKWTWRKKILSRNKNIGIVHEINTIDN